MQVWFIRVTNTPASDRCGEHTKHHVLCEYGGSLLSAHLLAVSQLISLCVSPALLLAPPYPVPRVSSLTLLTKNCYMCIRARGSFRRQIGLLNKNSNYFDYRDCTCWWSDHCRIIKMILIIANPVNLWQLWRKPYSGWFKVMPSQQPKPYNIMKLLTNYYVLFYFNGMNIMCKDTSDITKYFCSITRETLQVEANLSKLVIA